MKKRKIKRIIFVIVLLFIICLFLYLKFKEYNYQSNYVIDNFKIEEKYNLDNNKYTFLINYNDIIYPYNFENKYIRKKELIDNIKIYEDGNNICILPMSEYLVFYPLCNVEKEIVSYNLVEFEIDDFKYNKIIKNEISHNKIDVNYLDNNKYLLYNYKGFYYINDSEIKDIQLFNKDIYTLSLVYQLNEYLIIADYDKDHYFNRFYVINTDNGKLKEMEFDYDISFDSIFLGDYKNNIYLLDKKEEKEYKINLKKLEITDTDFVILKNKKLEKVTYKEIINNNLIFDNKENISYEIIDNKLYQIIDEYKVLITNKEITKIIKEKDNTIYYICNEELYMYNNISGEVLLISNFEWNFNNTNMIYLYK